MTNLFSFLSRFQKIALLVGFIPVVFYCYVIFHFSSNVPFYDDFFWAFDYLELYLQKNAFVDKIKMLFMQHNQHRFVYFRSILVSLFQMEGNVNFKHLILIGNISWFGIFGIYLVVFRRMAINWLYFLPIPFLLFQYQFMFNSIVSYGVPNMSIIFLAILTFYFACFAAPKHSYLIWIAGFVATFSNGNGIVVFFVAIILLLLQQKIKPAIYTALVYLCSLAIYFGGFQMNSEEAKLNGNTLMYFFRFLGAAFFTEINNFSVVLSAMAIIGLVVYAGFFLFKFVQHKYKPIENKVLLFCLGVFMFLACTSMMTAIVRAIHKVEIPDWYKNYSIIFVVTIYLFLLIFKKRRVLQISIFAVFFIYGVGIWYKSAEKNLVSYQFLKSTFEADVINFNRYHYWSFLTAQEGLAFYEKHNAITNDFVRKGYYQLPATPLTNHVFDSNKCKKVLFKIENSAVHYATLIQYDPADLGDKDRKYKERYGFIVNDSTQQVYYFGITPTFNGIRGIIKSKSLFFDKGGFGVKYKYFKNAVLAGTYRVGMVFVDGNSKAEWMISDQKINIDNE